MTVKELIEILQQEDQEQEVKLKAYDSVYGKYMEYGLHEDDITRLGKDGVIFIYASA